MTTYIEGSRGIFLGAQAWLIEDDREIADQWFSSHMTNNPYYKWTVGRFVEADRANGNKQLFSLDGLQMYRPTIAHAPMNMNHSARRVVGSYVATELVYPTDGYVAAKTAKAELDDSQLAADSPLLDADGNPIGEITEIAEKSDAGLNPYIEALGVFWNHYFPEEYSLVEAAHAEGRLYYSMECIPDRVQCAGEGGCGGEFEYGGRTSPSYCEHLNNHVSDKLLINPHFTAGAVLTPPIRPGWSHADVHSLVAKHCELAESIYTGLKAELSHLDPRDWELLMGELLALAVSE